MEINKNSQIGWHVGYVLLTVIFVLLIVYRFLLLLTTNHDSTHIYDTHIIITDQHGARKLTAGMSVTKHDQFCADLGESDRPNTNIRHGGPP